MPPYVIFKARSDKFALDWAQDGPENAMYTTSKSGWMEEQTYIDWFKEYKKYIRENLKLKGPILFFLDGYYSHLALEVIDLAIENDIHMLLIEPHSSHAWQPMDVGPYSPAKAAWHPITR